MAYKKRFQRLNEIHLEALIIDNTHAQQINIFKDMKKGRRQNFLFTKQFWYNAVFKNGPTNLT